MSDTLAELLARAAALQEEGRRVIGCLLVSARGSTPQPAGALMIVDDAANTFGTVGGGCVEAEIRSNAFDLLGRDDSGLLTFKLDHDYGWDDGLICGGSLEMAVGPLPKASELTRIVDDIRNRRRTALGMTVATVQGRATYTLNIPPRERLYIAGGGHIGQALTRLALSLDFEVSVFDDRHDLLKRLIPAGAKQVAGDIAEQLGQAAIDQDTFCVIVTRGHRHDEQALAAVLNRGAGYVGMIGSRRKVKLILDDLRERGITDESLAAVHAPIGLDIGAVGVEEIAVSIAGQLISARRKDRRRTVTGPVVQAKTE